MYDIIVQVLHSSFNNGLVYSSVFYTYDCLRLVHRVYAENITFSACVEIGDVLLLKGDVNITSPWVHMLNCKIPWVVMLFIKFVMNAYHRSVNEMS